MVRKEPRLTAADYRLTPEDGPRYELIDGELVLMPAPSARHQDIVSELILLIRSHVKSHRLGKALVAPLDVFLGDHDAYQPDVVFIATARRDRMSEDGVHGAPDLVVEVLSPSTRAKDERRKKPTYAAHGVRELWLVDLDAETVAVHRFERGEVVTLVRGDALTTDLLPGLTIDLDALFRDAA
jgi:Uma2 family endonuclease